MKIVVAVLGVWLWLAWNAGIWVLIITRPPSLTDAIIAGAIVLPVSIGGAIFGIFMWRDVWGERS